MALKTGPLTRDELRAVWEGALDKSYRDPIAVAGDGNGLEAHGQLWEQFARVSRAIDTTTQAMYISPWSGQSGPPASLEQKATVLLTFQRTGLLTQPLRLAAGTIYAEEETDDFSEAGTLPVRTGRRYALLVDLVFQPGDVGPFTVLAQAERPGYGYNNPLPGSIEVVSQPGSGFTNTGATVLAAGPTGLPAGVSASVVLASRNAADTFVPDHVGQYVQFTAGANLFKVARVVTFTPPNPTVPVGSAVGLELLQTIDATTFAGTFTAGETLNFTNGGPVIATGVYVADRIVGGRKKISYVVVQGAFASVVAGTVVTGAQSGATATVASIVFPQLLAAEAPVGGIGGASWRVLDWALDWGLTVTNVLSPAGGLAGMLEELGGERDIHRAPMEDQETYRQRVREIADVVTPNAIRRALARTMGTLPWCFREVGTASLPGFFYDGDNSPPGGDKATSTAAAGLIDAYDTDVIVFTGVLSSGVFVDQEPATLQDASANVIVRGYFGRLDGGVSLVFIRKSGRAPASLVGLTIVGAQSGAVFTPAAATVSPSVNARRFRLFLNYTEFRAFFLVGVPRFGAGEFGFAYDIGTDPYDGSPFNVFYDGYPYATAALYHRVQQAVDSVRAGGVSFSLYLEDIGCP